MAAGRGAGRAIGRQAKGGPLRALAGAILVLALLLAAGLAGAALVVQRRLDPAALAARIEQDALRQTGRTLTLSRLRVRLLPVPTIEAEDVGFGNWAQGMRPQMLTAARLQAHLALLPLLRHVVRLEGVTLTRPDLVLERAADGTANWQLHRLPRPEIGGGPAGGGARWGIEIGSVRLLDGRVAWSDARHGWTGAFDQMRLEASGLAGGAPSASLSGRHGGAGFQAEVSTGVLSRLDRANPSQAPWPVRIEASERQDDRSVGRIGIVGTVDDPARLRGYAFDVDAQAARLDALDALFPHAALPPVADGRLQLRVVDAAPAAAAASQPRVDRLDLRSGAFDTGALPRARQAAGLSVDRLSLRAGDRDAPLAVALDGRWQGQAVRLRGTLGTLPSWQGAWRGAAASAWGPIPVALDLAVGAAQLQARGSAGTASDLRVTVTAPTLRELLADGPALTAMAASARVQVQPPAAVTVSDLTLESRELGLAGSATLTERGHPTLTAAVTVAHADLDRLQTGWRAPETADAGAPAAKGPAASGGTGADTGAADDGTVPFAALRLADLAVRVDGQHLRLDGAEYHGLLAELAVHDGTLTLAPFSVDGPAGPIAGSLAASAADRSLTVTVRPSMVPAAMLAAWFGQASAVRGTVELVGDLTATGGTTGTLLASLTGRAGASIVDGEIAEATLAQLLGRVPALTALPGGGLGSGGSGAGGWTAVRCLALPARIAGGVATVAPLALQTARIAVQGHGTVGLTDGALDLHLLPVVAVGGAGASIPVHLGGTLAAPRAALDPAAPGGRFALTLGPAKAAVDPCGPALAAARFGAPGPLPDPDTAATRPRKGPKGLDILRGLGLFR